MPSLLPDWARAHGGTLLDGILRASPDDFRVDELLAIEFSGDGEHDWLRVEKRGSNTDWIARQLARHAGIRPSEVGYSGLKDRHAVSTQWFSVWRTGSPVDWSAFQADDARVLDIERHNRKLRRGTHSGNRFQITVRADGVAEARAELAGRVAVIRDAGVPNYFGEQRFGRAAGNVELALAVLGGRRVARHKRSLALSAGRSYLFNAILDARVRGGSWARLVDGERANLAGSGSVFGVDRVDDELSQRCADLDLHPTATLWGKGVPLNSAAAAELEAAAVRDFDATTPKLAAGLEKARVDAASRPTRLFAHELAAAFERDAVTFGFRLDKGGYATAVLREIVRSP